MIAFRFCATVEPAPRGRSKPVLCGDALRGQRLAHLQVDPVRLVELGRLGIRRTRAVQRVEIEARRACLQELCRRHVLTEHDVGLVEGEVVVDELSEIGEARRDLPCTSSAGRHGLADLPGVRLAELAVDSARPHPREAKRRHLRLDRGRERALAAPDALRQQTFADDEVALRPVALHNVLLSSRMRARMFGGSRSSTLQPERAIW